MVTWDNRDGSGGRRDFATIEAAEAFVKRYLFGDATRVWIDGVIVAPGADNDDQRREP
jgi:hypothetical protein